MKSILTILALTVSLNVIAKDCKTVAVKAAIKEVKRFGGACAQKPDVESADLMDTIEQNPWLETEIYEVVIESNCPGWVVFEVSVNHDSKGCKLGAIKVTAEE